MEAKFIVLFVIMIPLVTAYGNSFTQGEEINVFTGECIYQNTSNTNQYIGCDDKIECRMDAFFPDGTLIATSGECTREGNTFNYSFGYINETGIYTARVFLFGDGGWTIKNFTFTISDKGALEGAKNPFIKVGEFVNKRYAFPIGFLIFGEVFLFLWYILIKYGDKIKKLQKEENPKSKKIPLRRY